MMKNLKALVERRAKLRGDMTAMVEKADTENRALSEEEASAFDEAEAEIKALDETIARIKRMRDIPDEPDEPQGGEGGADTLSEEERAFADYVTGKVTELRAGEQNVTMGNNGAIIPTSIADKIIKKIKDVCPILERATMYNVKGTLKVPVWGKANTTHDIAVGYQTEFTDITADAGKFTSIDLSGYLAGALVLIGRSVENNGAFSVVDFITTQIAEEVAAWIEGQLLTGTGTSAAQGALNCDNTLTAAGATAITADELIELQSKVKQAYQGDAIWIMHPATFTAIKKLKDGNNRYLLQDDITGDFPFRLLGKPVYLSDNMPAVAASAKTILYGDMRGLSVNFRENISVEVLREKYATQHALGVVTWFEFDSKVTDNQRMAVLVQKES